MPNELVRVPLATNLLSREGTSAKDALIQNGLINAADQEIFVEKRPGFTEQYVDPATDVGLGVYAFDSEPFAVFGDEVFRGIGGAVTIFSDVAGGSTGSTVRGFVSPAISTVFAYGEDPLDVVVSIDSGASYGASTLVTIANASRIEISMTVHLGEIVLLGGFTLGVANTDVDTSLVADGVTFTAETAFPLAVGEGCLVSDGTSLYFTGFKTTPGGTISHVLYKTTDLSSWSVVSTIPGTSGNLIGFGNDGTTLYAISATSTTTADVFKSINGGVSFTTVGTVPSLVANFLILGSVGRIVTIGTGLVWINELGSSVFISNNDGVTWAGFVVVTGFNRNTFNSPLILGTSTVVISEGGATTQLVTFTGGSVPASLTIPAFVEEQMYFVGTDCGAATLGFLFKNATRAWFYNTTLNTITQVTDADYPALTVPGTVLLNGRFYVMTDKARIHNSALNDPFTWSALDVIGAIQDTDCGVALTRYRNYIVAFKEFTTEFFFDTGASPGSPIRRVDSAFTEIGCGDGNSVVSFENTVIFIGQSKRIRGTSVYMLDGYSPKKISNEFVERIIESDDLSATRAFAFDFHGKSHYIVQLNGGADATIVYNMDDGVWYKWTSRTAGTSQSVTSITFANNGVDDIATVSLTGHGFLDGDLMTIAGAAETEYNGTFQIQNVSGTSYDYILASTPAGPATGIITATGFTEGPYRPVGFMASGGLSLLQDGLNGKLYSIADASLTDDGVYIDYLVRTPLVDFGNTMTKFIRRVEPIGDKTEASSNLLIRHTDDDYQTFSPYRKVDLNRERPQLKRLGSTRRRGYEVRHTDTPRIRLSALEVEADIQGIT